MSFRIMRVIVTAVLYTTVSFGDQVVIPVRDNVNVYENQFTEKVIFTVHRNEPLKVSQNQRGRLLISDETGKSGWIEKSDAGEMSKNRTIQFENIEIAGYIDNPQPLYITVPGEQDDVPLTLNRSFKESLRENVDKETVSRSCAQQ